MGKKNIGYQKFTNLFQEMADAEIKKIKRSEDIYDFLIKIQYVLSYIFMGAYAYFFYSNTIAFVIIWFITILVLFIFKLTSFEILENLQIFTNITSVLILSFFMILLFFGEDVRHFSLFKEISFVLSFSLFFTYKLSKPYVRSLKIKWRYRDILKKYPTVESRIKFLKDNGFCCDEKIADDISVFALIVGIEETMRMGEKIKKRNLKQENS